MALLGVAATAAGTFTFVSQAPSPTFLADCLPSSAGGDDPNEASEVCHETLFGLHLNQGFLTVIATFGTLLIPPLVIVNLLVLWTWVPLILRRGTKPHPSRR